MNKIFTNIGDVIKEFKRLGWDAGSDAGDRYVLKNFEDRVLQMFIKVEKRKKNPGMIVSPYVSSPTFDTLLERISEEPHPLSPLVGSIGWGRKRTLIPAPITEEVIAQVAQEFGDWAMAQDLNAVKERLRGLPTDSVGLNPLMHLAALAEAGDVEKLQSYADAFARGDRLGFVPYITEDYIARALEIAKERASEMGS